MAWLSRISSELGRTRSLALAGAAVWSVLLIVGALSVPMYSTDSSNGAGSTTLVGENGSGVLIPMSIPLVLVLAVATALSRDHRPAAWTVTGLLAVFNLLAMLSIGLFILPITVALIAACTRPGTGSPRYVEADVH